MSGLIEDDIDAALADVAARFAANVYQFEARLRLPAPERRYSRANWQSLADMGWFSVALPEEFDGLGLRLSSIAVLAEAAGAMQLAEPLTDTAFVGAFLIAAVGTDEQKASLLQRISAGSLCLSTALEPSSPDARIMLDADGRLAGALTYAPGADIADSLLVSVDDGGRRSVRVVDLTGEGVTVTSFPLIDGRGAAKVAFANAPSSELGDGTADAGSAIEAAQSLGALATAADSLGAMERLQAVTVEYLKTRVQFGRPIGANQVLQHRAVDMQIELERGRAVVAAAIRAGTPGSVDFAHAVHAAKAIVGRAARQVAHGAVQLHGGIGMAEEHVVGHYLKRIMVNEQLYGSTATHRQAFIVGLVDDFDGVGDRGVGDRI